jgi:hypothetical protein
MAKQRTIVQYSKRATDAKPRPDRPRRRSYVRDQPRQTRARIRRPWLTSRHPELGAVPHDAIMEWASVIAECAGAITICPRHAYSVLRADGRGTERTMFALGKTMIAVGQIKCDCIDLICAIRELLETAEDACPRCAVARRDKFRCQQVA